MSKISEEQVKKVAELSRIQLNNEEISNHAKQLEIILDYIDQLQKINTDHIECTTRAIEVVNVVRTDRNIADNSRNEILNLAPSREDDFYKVPKIIKE